MLFEPFNQPQYVSFQTNVKEISNSASIDYLELSKYNISYFSGLSMGKKGVINGRFASLLSEKLTIDDVRYSYGEWMAIAENKVDNEVDYLVFTDDYGYSPAFYAFIPNECLIVSDSFHGVVAALEERGISRTLDIKNYVSSVTTQAAHFQNSFSRNTMAAEIKLMLPGQCFHVSNSSVLLVDWQNANSDKSYESCMEDGYGLATTVLRLLNEAPELFKRITLSGGVDSRVALALIKRAGVERGFSVFSMDPRTWSRPLTKHIIKHDVVIANLIRERLGMQWWKRSDRKMISLDFMESLASFQSYRSNFSYTFTPASTHTIFSQKMLTIRGGGGEMLRSTAGGLTMSNRFESEKGRASISGSEEAEWLSDTFARSSLISPKFKSAMKDLIIESYESSKGSSFEERMNSFYFNYRNRAHFGHSRHSGTANDLTLHLLSNPHFLEASKKVSFGDKSAGLIVRDIFNDSAPELLGIPFEDQVWTDRLARNPVDVDLEGDGWQGSYDRSLTGQPKPTFFSGWGRGERGEKFTFDSEALSINYIVRGFSVIESFVSAESKPDLLDQHNLILKAIRNKKINIFGIVAKVASALDVFVPYSANGHSVQLGFNNTQMLGAADAFVAPARPTVISDGISNVPVFEQCPEMTREVSGFRIQAKPQTSAGSLMDYAFYLLKDGKRIAQRWYEESDCAVFVGDFEAGTYSGIAFARPRGKSSPTYQKNTGKITL